MFVSSTDLLELLEVCSFEEEEEDWALFSWQELISNPFAPLAPSSGNPLALIIVPLFRTDVTLPSSPAVLPPRTESVVENVVRLVREEDDEEAWLDMVRER